VGHRSIRRARRQREAERLAFIAGPPPELELDNGRSEHAPADAPADRAQTAADAPAPAPAQE
jgi:hypothetical protein